ncbi:hypothetical protein LCGC14_2124370 [marine sediment metagenome]|uniref:Uncharacterized protein n=1 Tax=marine sediment metagenome TaxID=412755 RepID=A0A0F9GZJ2_9ZZZZ
MEEEKVTVNEIEVIARKAHLEQELRAARSMVDALSGAVQDCDWWLEKLAAKEEEKKAELKQLAEAKAVEEAAKKNKRKRKK